MSERRILLPKAIIPRSGEPNVDYIIYIIKKMNITIVGSPIDYINYIIIGSPIDYINYIVEKMNTIDEGNNSA